MSKSTLCPVIPIFRSLAIVPFFRPVFGGASVSARVRPADPAGVSAVRLQGGSAWVRPDPDAFFHGSGFLCCSAASFE